MTEPAPFFELRLDGAQPARFPTPQDAMTAAEDHPHPTGEIVYYAPGSTQAVPVILYRQGRIETAPSLAADDDEDDSWFSEPWTDEEIAENWRRGRPLTDEERAKYGLA